MKKINIDLTSEDSSYIVSPSLEQDLPILDSPELKEIQDNYFIINENNSLPLQDIFVPEPSCGPGNSCDIIKPNTNEACISYQDMVKYVTERLKNYIIISATAPQNPIENQLWIQI